jgi:phosphatidylglycerophosphate synthase
MLDSTLRPVKDRALGPLAGSLRRVPPIAISAVGLALSLAAATAAWQQAPLIAVPCWLLGRVADGIDGIVARSAGTATDVGGLLDFVFDTIGYAAIPIGLAFGIDDRAGWMATAVLLGTFYLNAVTLGYVAALLEKRNLGAAAHREPTSTTLPRGLIEGSETIVFFTIALTFPQSATAVWWVMAAAVAATALERIRWAIGRIA